jgi:hypothetical protein
MIRGRPHSARPVITTRTVAGSIIGLVVVLACAARLVHLDADPYFATWIGYITDEGRWSETARNLALFGTPDLTEVGRLHLLLSPGYQGANYLAFRLFGVDLWSARAFAAVAGIILVLIVLLALRRHVSTFALALGAVILGFETNMFAQSRMALPEVPAALGCVLAFLVLVLAPKRPSNAFLAGLFAAAAVAIKGTSVLTILIFPFIPFLTPRGGPARERIMRALAFLAGFVVCALAGLGSALALGLVGAGEIGGAGRIFLNFLSPAAPYTAVQRFLDSAELEARNLLLLGAWFCSWVWFHREPRAPSPAGELYVASGVWAGWWLLMWSGIDYLPGRYVVHFVVPATIHLMAGLSLMGRGTLARIASALGRRRGVVQAASLAWLALPSAILIAPAVAGFVEAGGWDVPRVSVRIALIGATTAMLLVVARRAASREGIAAAFLILPILMTLLWLGGRELTVFRLFWQFDSATSLGVWTALSGSAVAVGFVLALRPRYPGSPAVVQSCVIVLMAVIFVAQGAPPILAPTYSIRDASRHLGQQLSPSALRIRSLNAASIFLENKLRYRELAGDDELYDIIVVFEHGRRPRRFLESGKAANLLRVQTYPLTISPKYETLESKYGPPSIAVFKVK